MAASKANILYILEILKEYSDAEHVLQMHDLISKMKSLYSVEVDRRTVYSSIETLKNTGFDISTYNDNGVGYYLVERPLEVAEVRLLMDSVYSNQYIPIRQTEQLIGKLQLLLNNNFRKKYKNLSVVKTDRKTVNQSIFLNIEVLDEAISQKKKVSFTYMEYGMDKKLHARRSEKYTVNPYQMISTNEHYYLVCKMHEDSNISLYRIDLMKDVSISEYGLDGPLKEKELNNAKNKTIYAWYGDAEEVELKCKNYVLGDVIDKFGQGIRVDKLNDGEFMAHINTAPRGVQYWALQYLPHVEVIRPKWLRDAIIESIKNNPYCEV